MSLAPDAHQDVTRRCSRSDTIARYPFARPSDAIPASVADWFKEIPQ